MRPESVREFRARTRDRARSLIADCVVSGEIRITVRNGVAKDWPTPETVAENADLKTDWEQVVFTLGIRVEDGFVTTKLGLSLYRVAAVHFPSAASLCAFLGGDWVDRTAEAEVLTKDVPELRTPDMLRLLLSFEAEDLRVLRRLCAWRRDTPVEELGLLMLREISVPGMSTKWVEKNAALVLTVFERSGWTVKDVGTLSERLGLDAPDTSDVRVRVHPEDAEASSLWERFAVPSTMFRTFPFRPDEVLIVENKTTFLRVPVKQVA